ncbi:probable thiopurine S-methyltransferase [Pollicipes pollicipes]|uniref:probable thiopurine S-methyltransferase n=1 Tax=Pollicipes pollicipes TaxID=41117 RepID=UPI0018849970|nr:probable thiopurine S-methyltransferase [Pollicipes pollicipes]XP_037086046.1 probable thiopurine S-methyltransferase [Pollicipes pollicipes]XP_037086047.1 probable thiopurine S-methyltransferase [Pollicipes pollicipes]
MAGTADRLEGWADKWSADIIPFHRADVNPHLMKWCHKLAHDDQPSKFLVPLCGKSVDMMWLYKKGHTVFGIEGVEKAIVQFFTENDLKYTKSPTGAGQLFQTADGRLQLHQADICEMDPALIGPVDAIWDRGSYVAIYCEDRPKYAKFMKGVMSRKCHYLLWAVEYDSSLFSGPPRNLSKDDIEKDCGSFAKIECLTCDEHTVETFPKMANWNLKEMKEVVYMLTLK